MNKITVRLKSVFMGLVFITLLLVMLSIFPACSVKPVSLADIPLYPESIELKPGESRIGDAQANNVKDDAVMKKIMEYVIGGGKLAEMTIELPEGTSWGNILDFYQDKLVASGWSNAVGGVPRKVLDVSGLMGGADEDRQYIHSTMFSRGSQTLAIVMVSLPDEQNYRELILSLVTK